MWARPKLDPDVDDLAPAVQEITNYDETHFVTYMRLLDAEADRAGCMEVARVVLHRDPAIPTTQTCWESHLARARWMTQTGYQYLLERTSSEARSRPH